MRYLFIEREVRQFPNGQALVSVGQTGTRRLLTATEAQILFACRDPRSIADHVEILRAGGRLGSANSIAERLDGFAREGLLREETFVVSTLQNRCRQVVARPTSRISTICIPTRNRAKCVRRAILSCVENAIRHDRTPGFLVIDDGTTPQAVRDTLGVVREIATSTGFNVRYADRRAREVYARQLSKYSGVEDRVVKFAILGDRRFSRVYGATRNSLLLDTLDSSSLQIDDDMVCGVFIPEGIGSSLSLTSTDPTAVRFWSDREDILASVRQVNVDYLACHEAVLGRAPAECINAAVDSDSAVLLSGRVGNDLIDVAAAADSCMDLSFGGIVGELGGPGWHHWRLALTGESFTRFISDPDIGRSMHSSYVSKCAPWTTLTDGAYCLTGNMGVYNHGQLPPFMPVEMMEDTVFGALRRCVYPRSMSALIPYAIFHDPSRSRPGGHRPLSLPMNSIVRDLIVQFQSNWPGRRSHLHVLGTYLEEVGRLQPGAFRSFVREATVRMNLARVRELEKMRQERSFAPDWWHTAVRDCVDELRGLTVTGEPAAPDDLRGTPEKRQELFQDAMVTYGRVLQEWAMLIQAARELAARGVQISRRIRSLR